MTDPLIRVRGLEFGWDSHVLLRDASFDIERHDVFLILGGSGSGKSTLLRHLIGLETPRAGSIEIEGIGTPRLEGGAPLF
ncbi:MAG TPA: ATP-binding cassette domain-containing protein, partial [Polyangiaceae bacterium]|nr:ATP-binding cassette domain-containing protein [Polyangiaceae bacterium]